MVAWSPNPKNPPYYADSPLKDGKVDPLVMAEVGQQLAAGDGRRAMSGRCRSFNAIGSDVGTKDGLIRTTPRSTRMLDTQGMASTWATYEGTHIDHIAQRFDQVVLPFFAQHLAKQ